MAEHRHHLQRMTPMHAKCLSGRIIVNQMGMYHREHVTKRWCDLHVCECVENCMMCSPYMRRAHS